jgi:hypothetical protein
MKRKIQPNAVNNQEDEDSCAYPIYFPNDASVGKKEDTSVEETGDQVFSEGSSNKGELTSNRE